MTKSYASSVYSQKSTASARSGRSFLSFTAGATIWPSFTTIKNHNVEENATPPDSLNQGKQSVWKNLKSWIPSTKKDDGDDETNTIKSSSSSLGKWKKLLVSPTQYMGRQRDQPTTVTTSSIDTASLSDKASSITTHQQQEQQHYQPGGILVNIGAGSAQDIAEQKKRRKQRRLYLMRVQLRQQQQQSTAATNHRLSNSSSLFGSIDTPQDDMQHKRQVGFNDNMYEYSSSSTLLSTPPDGSITMLDKLDNNGTDVAWYSAAPRVMFVEPSPVPRFRNEPPAPPPSPPYLNVIVQPLDSSNPNNSNNTSTIDRHSLIAENDHSDIPTIFTTIPPQIKQQHPVDLPEQRPRLVFTSPLERGQTITFSLQNAIPDDHLIIYKFLTSNSRLQRKDSMGLVSSPSWAPSSAVHPSTTERYFVRPSAGLMTATHADVMLFLNQTPSPLAPGEILKDKILVRWAVIQRGTQVEAWTKQLKESNRRKWLEMLLEEWPDQVVERRTRISIRFV